MLPGVQVPEGEPKRKQSLAEASVRLFSYQKCLVYVAKEKAGYKAGNIKQNIMQRLRSTFSVQFYCRESKAKNGLSPIEAGININGNRFFYNLPRKAKPSTFQKTEKEYLYAIERRIRQYELDCLADGDTMTVEGMKEYIRNNYTRPGKTIKDLLQSFYTHLQKKVDAGMLMDSGLRKYRTAISLFVQDLDQDKPVTVITSGYIDDFCLKVGSMYESSTGSGMLTKVKSLLSYAVMNGYITVNPWKTKISKKVKKIEIPTMEEYNKVVNLDLSFNKSLERARDLWVFASGCGLSYCDCATLEDGDIKEMNGQYYINKERGKTGVEFFSILLPNAVAVYKKYGGLPKMISNQKINAYIKVVGEMAGVGVSLHFHLARHLYCHQLLNIYKVSYDIAAKCLGHSQIKQTMHYGKIWGSTVLDAFN